MTTTTLGALLADPSAQPPGVRVWLREDEQPWTLDAIAVIGDPSDDAFIETLQTDDFADIVLNADEQLEDLSAEEKLEAFQYYWDHDAFIAWEFEDDD